MSDPVYNEPVPYELGGGLTVYCREIPYTRALAHAREFFGLFRKLQASNPGMDWGQMDAGAITGFLFTSFDQIIEHAQETVHSVMRETVTVQGIHIGGGGEHLITVQMGVPLEPSDLERLSASQFIELFMAVLEANEPVIRAFLRARGRLAELFRGTNGSGTRSGSRSLSAVGSNTGT